MTDKYTKEDVSSMISTSDIDYVTELMNYAYKEGKKDEHKSILGCAHYPICAHFSGFTEKYGKELINKVEELEKENEKLKKENESLKKTIFDLKVKNATILNREQKSLTEKAKAWCNLNYQNLKEYDIVNLKLGAYQEHLEQENEKLKERIDCWNKYDYLRNEVETITNQLINLLNLLGGYPHQSPEAPE